MSTGDTDSSPLVNRSSDSNSHSGFLSSSTPQHAVTGNRQRHNDVDEEMKHIHIELVPPNNDRVIDESKYTEPVVHVSNESNRQTKHQSAGHTNTHRPHHTKPSDQSAQAIGATATAAISTTLTAVPAIDLHQSLLAQATRDDLVTLNASLLQEIQYYDLLTRELSTELESSLSHVETLQGEHQTSHTTLEDTQVALEVLKAQKRREDVARETERQQTRKTIQSLRQEIARLKRVMKTNGFDTVAGQLQQQNQRTVSSSIFPGEIRVNVVDSNADTLTSTSALQQPIIEKTAAKRRKKPAGSGKKKKKLNREARARMQPAMNMNGTDAELSPTDIVLASTSSAEEDEDGSDESSSSDSETSALEEDDPDRARSSDKENDENEVEEEKHDKVSDPSTLRLAQSVDGVLSGQGAADVTNAAQAPFQTLSHQPPPLKHPFLHLGLLDSHAAPVSAQEYLTLHEAHEAALERVKIMENKLLEQQRSWTTYLELVQTRYRATLQAHTRTVHTQTPMLLNTPALGSLSTLLDERLVFVTPNIWRAVGKARMKEQQRMAGVGMERADETMTVETGVGTTTTGTISTDVSQDATDRFIIPSPTAGARAQTLQSLPETTEEQEESKDSLESRESVSAAVATAVPIPLAPYPFDIPPPVFFLPPAPAPASTSTSSLPSAEASQTEAQKLAEATTTALARKRTLFPMVQTIHHSPSETNQQKLKEEKEAEAHASSMKDAEAARLKVEAEKVATEAASALELENAPAPVSISTIASPSGARASPVLSSPTPSSSPPPVSTLLTTPLSSGSGSAVSSTLAPTTPLFAIRTAPLTSVIGGGTGSSVAPVSSIGLRTPVRPGANGLNGTRIHAAITPQQPTSSSTNGVTSPPVNKYLDMALQSSARRKAALAAAITNANTNGTETHTTKK